MKYRLYCHIDIMLVKILEDSDSFLDFSSFLSKLLGKLSKYSFLNNLYCTVESHMIYKI